MEVCPMESVLIAKNEAVAQQWWRQSEELRRMTFQIALIGKDGLVVASDRRSVHALAPSHSQVAFPQTSEEQKFVVSPNQNVVCFFAGGAMSVAVAREIALKCAELPESVALWQQAIYQVAMGVPLPYIYPIDDILIVRKDAPNGVWLIRRSRIEQNVVVEVLPQTRTGLCTGASLVAQFLPTHLGGAYRSIAELKVLALLTLSYAAQEEPTYVGAPFDLMTLDRFGNVSWSVHRAIHQTFHEELRQLFSREVERGLPSSDV
jgi:hypothetical protein